MNWTVSVALWKHVRFFWNLSLCPPLPHIHIMTMLYKFCPRPDKQKKNFSTSSRARTDRRLLNTGASQTVMNDGTLGWTRTFIFFKDSGQPNINTKKVSNKSFWKLPTPSDKQRRFLTLSIAHRFTRNWSSSKDRAYSGAFFPDGSCRHCSSTRSNILDDCIWEWKFFLTPRGINGTKRISISRPTSSCMTLRSRNNEYFLIFQKKTKTSPKNVGEVRPLKNLLLKGHGLFFPLSLSLNVTPICRVRSILGFLPPAPFSEHVITARLQHFLSNQPRHSNGSRSKIRSKWRARVCRV